jgi:ATP-dependent Clp protease adaptor protein ClpS
VIVLERFFGMSHDEAVAHMFRIHNEGKAIPTEIRLLMVCGLLPNTSAACLVRSPLSALGQKQTSHTSAQCPL